MPAAPACAAGTTGPPVFRAFGSFQHRASPAALGNVSWPRVLAATRVPESRRSSDRYSQDISRQRFPPQGCLENQLPMMKNSVNGKPVLDPSDQKLSRRRARSPAAGAGQGDHAGRVHATRPPGAGRGVLEALLPHTGRSIRLGISGSPGCGKVDVHRGPGPAPDRPGPPGRGAGGGPLQLPLRRLDPGRQDPHGAAVAGAQLVHPPVAVGRLARRRGGEDPRGDARLRGGRLRRDHRRDRGRGPVGDGRGRHGRRLRADPAPQRRRRPPGDQEGHRRARRHRRDQQGRPRPQGGRPRQAPVRRCARDAPQRLAQLASAGGDGERHDRDGHRRLLGRDRDASAR